MIDVLKFDQNSFHGIGDLLAQDLNDAPWIVFRGNKII